MTTHFITAEVDLPDTAEQLHQAIKTELSKQGEPLRWAVTDVDVPRQKALIEGIVSISSIPQAVTV